MFIMGNGEVGIGSDNPQKNLDIYTGQAHATLRLHNLNNGGTGYDSELSIFGRLIIIFLSFLLRPLI